MVSDLSQCVQTACGRVFLEVVSSQAEAFELQLNNCMVLVFIKNTVFHVASCHCITMLTLTLPWLPHMMTVRDTQYLAARVSKSLIHAHKYLVMAQDSQLYIMTGTVYVL